MGALVRRPPAGDREVLRALAGEPGRGSAGLALEEEPEPPARFHANGGGTAGGAAARPAGGSAPLRLPPGGRPGPQPPQPPPRRGAGGAGCWRGVCASFPARTLRCTGALHNVRVQTCRGLCLCTTASAPGAAPRVHVRCSTAVPGSGSARTSRAHFTMPVLGRTRHIRVGRIRSRVKREKTVSLVTRDLSPVCFSLLPSLSCSQYWAYFFFFFFFPFCLLHLCMCNLLQFF